MKGKYLPVLALASGLTLNANAQKSDFQMYKIKDNSKKITESSKNNKFRAQIEGLYNPKTQKFGAEATLQGDIGNKTWIGPYVKKNEFEGNSTFSENTRTKTSQIFNKLYSQTEKIVSKEIYKESLLELGLKFSQQFGSFEAGLGFGYDLRKEMVDKTINGKDRTLELVNGEYKTLEEKSFSMPKESNNSESWQPTINAELKWNPTNFTTLGVEGSYNLKDKRPEIRAKAGFRIGGKK